MPFAIDFNIFEGSIGDSGSDMYSELLEFLILELDVIELEFLFTEFEGIVVSWFEMLKVTPSTVEHVSALVLTFYD